MSIEDTATKLAETARTYRYADTEIQLENVVELVVRESGTHRVKTADGRLHIIAAGWLAITIEDPTHDWTM